jgi:hypothetical protein
MTPHKATNGRGTLLLDRIFAGVGRIRRASGTNKVRERDAINAMLTELYEQGKDRPAYHRVLELIASGELKPFEVWKAYRAGSLDQLRDVKTSGDLETAWTSWQDGTTNRQTRQQRAASWKRLLTVLPAHPTIGALPEALLAMRETFAGQPPAFNRTKAAVQAFCRDRLTKLHPIYLACRAVEPLPEFPAEREAPTIRRAMLARATLAALSPKAADIWWSMYLLGTNPDEFDLAWVVRPQEVFVPGTKRRGRRRRVPLLGTLHRRGMGWTQYRAVLKEADLGLQPNDARRGYEHLLEESAIPATRIKLYMGHRLNVTERYGRAELDAFLVADADRIRARLAQEEAALVAEARGEMRLA